MFGTNVKKLVIGEKVKTIPAYSFYNCKALTRVLFPTSLKQIGTYAFYDSGLKQVDIPEFVTLIDTAAFAHCVDLENIFVDSKNSRYYSDDGVLLNKYRNRIYSCPGAKESYIIPDTVTYVEDQSFAGCVNLSEIEFTENIKEVGNLVFLDATGLETVTYYGEYLTADSFKNCINLENLTLGDNLRKIDSNPFQGCRKLKELTIPESVVGVDIYDAEGIEVLYWNTNICEYTRIPPTIKEIYFGDNVTKIPNNFLENSNVEEFKIPDTITDIGDNAFDGCNNLTAITIPDSVQRLGSAFKNCNNLVRVTVPSSVSQIFWDNSENQYAFKNCNSDLTIVGYRNSYIEEFAYKADIMFSAMEDRTEGNYTYLTKNGESVIIKVDNAVSGNITVPNSLGGCPVTEIGSYAFSGCRNITNIILPQTVTHIGINAFYNCSSMESIDIPKGVDYIGEYAFSGCNNLNSVEMPTEIKRIASGVFLDCSSLTNINIPEGVTYIGSYAFMRTGITKVTLPDTLTEVRDNAFAMCEKLKEVSFGSNIQKIGELAFAETGIEAIQIPETVLQIGNDAFAMCENLKSLVINDAPVSIGGGAFSNTNLTEVNLGNAVKRIGSGALTGVIAKELVIPKSVISIGESAFPNTDDFAIVGYMGSITERYCRTNGYMFLKLDNVYEHYYYLIENGEAILTGTDGLLNGIITLPNNIEGYPVTKIGQKAFMSRKSINGVIVPESITNIAYNAFSDCKGMILQGSDYVYEYTVRNGLSFSENLTRNQYDIVDVNDTISVEDDSITGDIALELDSHLNSFIDWTNIYLAVYCDGEMVGMISGNMIPSIGKEYISFKDIGIKKNKRGVYTVKLMLWDSNSMRPFANLYQRLFS